MVDGVFVRSIETSDFDRRVTEVEAGHAANPPGWR